MAKKVVVKNNARDILERLLKLPENVALHREAQNKARGQDEVNFSTALQNLFTRVGLIVSEVVVSPKISNKVYFVDSVNYIGIDILKDRSVVHFMRATQINPNANRVKHKLVSVRDLNIIDTVDYYNKVINRLATILKLKDFNKLTINLTTRKGDIPNKTTINVEKFYLTASLDKNEGVLFKKPIFGKREKLMTFNFNLSIKTEYKIKSIITEVEGKGKNKITLKARQGLNQYKLKSNEISGNLIVLTCKVIYRVGFLKEKEVKFTISYRVF